VSNWTRVLKHASKWTRVIIHVSSWTSIWNTRVQLDTHMEYTCPTGHVYFYTCQFWTRASIHVSKWTRVLVTRVQMDTCIQYTCPFWTALQFDTCQIGRVSTVTGTVDTRQIDSIFVVLVWYLMIYVFSFFFCMLRD
jgi:hypothetical protein